MKNVIRNRVKSIETISDAIRIVWTDENESVLHFIWLRDSCSCIKCGSHNSGSRFQSFLDIPLGISPSIVNNDSTGITITWNNDGHESRYEYEWLYKHCYRISRLPKKTLWNSQLSSFPEINYRLALENDTELYKLFSNVSEYGFVIVKDVGIDPDETLKLAKKIGYVRETHFGHVGNLTLRVNGTHIADFPTEILPHTDETYRPTSIGINIFHCIQPSDDGGGISTLVDSHYCGNQLASKFPESFDLLIKIPIQHEHDTEDEIIHSNHPVFTVDYDGNITEVRLNERTMSAIQVKGEQMKQVYDALRKTFVIAYGLKNRINYRLESGEALIFDNLRILHGRTAFQSDRVLRQTNIFRDEFYARESSLEESKLNLELTKK